MKKPQNSTLVCVKHGKRVIRIQKSYTLYHLGSQGESCDGIYFHTEHHEYVREEVMRGKVI